jgi:cytochrome d ubiquinol oxidase subunit I
LLDLSRWQFAIMVMFHMTFPAITVGLSIFLSVLYGMHWNTGSPVYLQMFRFWRRIFAVGFAIGVVAGIVITFELGLNWGVYAAKTGPIIGPIVGMEVVTAFFVEAGFIGILLYGDGRVRPATMLAATVMVAIGVSHVGPRRHARLLGQRTPGVVGPRTGSKRSSEVGQGR